MAATSCLERGMEFLEEEKAESQFERSKGGSHIYDPLHRRGNLAEQSPEAPVVEVEAVQHLRTLGIETATATWHSLLKRSEFLNVRITFKGSRTSIHHRNHPLQYADSSPLCLSSSDPSFPHSG